MDIIVTTPKKQMKIAKYEAESCKKVGGGKYYRHLATYPKVEKGDRVFYTEDGFVRGFAVIEEIFGGRALANEMGMIVRIEKSFLKRDGCTIVMDATSWKWIKPIPLKGFQGWRYYRGEGEVIGNWLDPKPITKST